MGKPHTEDAKQKISMGVRRQAAEKKQTNVAAEKRGAELAAHFASGHPDRMPPSAVRTYGDMGRVEGAVPEARRNASLTSHEEKVVAAETTAEALGLRRSKDLRTAKEGSPGGLVERPNFGAGRIEDVPGALMSGGK